MMLLRKSLSIVAIGSHAIPNAFSKIFSRSYLKKPFSYENKYRGLYDYHDRDKYPRSLNAIKEEELLEEIHTIKNAEVHPSPFHIVKRIRGTAGTIKGWSVWVSLRRLNLHSSGPGDISIIPNTPQFNSLILRVKHLVTVTPVILPDGRFPTEEDIGALKICPATGKVTIDERLRLLAKRQYEKPELWKGNHLRWKLKELTGIHKSHYLS